MNGALSALGLAGAAAIFAAVAAGWTQVKALVSRITGLLVISVEFHGELLDAGRIYCRDRLRATPTPFRTYFSRAQFIRPLGRYGVTAYEEVGRAGRLYRLGHRPVWVTLVTRQQESSYLSLRFLRGTLDPDRLAADAAAAMNAEACRADRSSRFKVVRMAGFSGKGAAATKSISYSESGNSTASSPPSSGPLAGRLVGWAEDDVGESTDHASSALERLSLAPDIEAVVEKVRRWHRSKEWYAQRQIAWRLGCNFYGQAGTGKSSLAKAIAQDLGIPIFAFDLATMDNGEFHAHWDKTLQSTPCIALMEDVDAVFEGRTNVAAEKGKGLTFDCLLNAISGVQATDGVLLIITTNNIEKIDPALGVPDDASDDESRSTRPGRIDYVVELRPLDEAGRRKLATRILEGCHPSWIDHLVTEGRDDTGAQFEYRCASSALSLYWSNDPERAAPPCARERRSA